MKPKFVILPITFLVCLFCLTDKVISQQTQEKYPNLSGFWKIKNGNIVHIYQVGNVVYFANRENQTLFLHKGNLTGSKTIIMNCKYISNSSQKTQNFTGNLTIINSKKLLWDFNTGTQTLEFVNSD
jgi:hypothetical protein